ncbi:hypothetical protein ACLKA7_013287 [Drosophila subpalustris]
MDTATGAIVSPSDTATTGPIDDIIQLAVPAKEDQVNEDSDVVQADQKLTIEVPRGSKTLSTVEPNEGNEEKATEDVNLPEAIEKRNQEKKEERRARLKKARGIRFNVGEKEIDEEKPTEKSMESSLHTDTEQGTAFATPTRFSEHILQDIPDINAISLTMSVESENVEKLLDHYSDESQEAIESTTKGDSIKLKTDFLNEFELPSLSDISEEADEEFEAPICISSKQPSVHSIHKDKGKFVDPLTGGDISSSSSSSSSSSTESQVIDGESKSDVSFLEFNELIDLPVQYPVAEDEDFEQFVRFSLKPAPKENEDTVPIVLNESHEIIKHFLSDILDDAINQVEKLPEIDKCRGMLDNEKLHNTLAKIYEEYCITKDQHMYLNHKVGEYYRRQKIVRAFATLTPTIAQMEYERYMDALENYDYYLNLIATTKGKRADVVSSTEQEMTDLNEASMRREKLLEDKILGIIGNKYENLRKIANRELRLMRIYRDEISDTRFALITRKHTLAVISDKILKCDQISETLTANEFIDLQNQVVALEVKIDEKNHELKKMRQLYHTHVHVSQHFRECTLTLEEKLKEHRSTLEMREERRQNLRERLFKAKLVHNRLKKQKMELTFQGGLLTTPVLMYDYDETLAKVTSARSNIKNMKETAKRLAQRIDELQTTCV